MPTVTFKPCAQRHEWNLYLNAAMFTSTVVLDPVSADVDAVTKVGETVDFVRARAGRADRAPPRRVREARRDHGRVLADLAVAQAPVSMSDEGRFPCRYASLA